MPLHENELVVDEDVVRSLIAEQCPQWAGLPLTPAGAGTENTMYRLGDGLLVRLPRSVEKAAPLRTEQRWLPVLAPLLPLPIPAPVYAGRPSDAYPAPWSVLRWLDGAPPHTANGPLATSPGTAPTPPGTAGTATTPPGTVTDWRTFARDLSGFIRTLHGIDLMGATGPRWYRGGELAPCDEWARKALADCRPLVGDTIDIDLLEHLWTEALRLPRHDTREVWLHTDLKPTNLLVRDGRLAAVIDFGGLSIGYPDAEHAPVWDLPASAREAYWDAANLDDITWQRARAWAIVVGASGIPYYWHTYPDFVAECRARLSAIATGV
ncbi:phosphotransferase [Paractinoplanes deccanensis]|uniref:Phosphotransferase n=1 Tax=Paractinoplanes deccanensis TaxID=113561 RepID=A0ABQ3YGT2_9ACTN|nr:phosphotransferase [Actinoplanes deccanensis]GID79218.1 phosphotransferase [Actinoplanes deccanensis]